MTNGPEFLGLVEAIGDYGGQAGIDTDLGRLVVSANVHDFRQNELPIKVITPGRDTFEDVLLLLGVTVMKLTRNEKTPFGLDPNSIAEDCIIFKRI